MRLKHYSSKPFLLEDRVYPQESQLKPWGFWVSIENKEAEFFDWQDWCELERFGLGKYEHSVQLSDDARILKLTAIDEMHEFNSRYRDRDPIRPHPHIRWDEVAKEYQGIFIYPYHYEMRCADGFLWYYTWDCSSGCIWDLDAISSVDPIDLDLDR